MTAQYIGCTIYFHSFKRYSKAHFEKTSSCSVSRYWGLHQPSVLTSGMPVGTGGKVKRAPVTGIPWMGRPTMGRFGNTRTRFAMPASLESTWRPPLKGIGRLGGILGSRYGPGTGVGIVRGVGELVGFGKRERMLIGLWNPDGGLIGRIGSRNLWGSASTIEAKAARARITCQIESMIFSVLSVCWILIISLNV
jgi:hypothetical protein